MAAILVMPLMSGAAIAPIAALVQGEGRDDGETFLIVERGGAHRRQMPTRAEYTHVLFDAIAEPRFGTVNRAPSLPPSRADGALLACCFYHRWMDEKRRDAVDRAVACGHPVVMIVTASVARAADVARALLASIDVPVQLHELLPTWVAGGPDGDPS